MASKAKVDVKLSQESLFFPLPFASAAIENVIKIDNKLPADPNDPTKNVTSFKVLSAVRHRYSVKPAIGFILPGKSVTIRFTLDPESIRQAKDPKDRELPTKETKDSIYLDFAVVDNSGSSGVNVVKNFIASASAAHGNEAQMVQEDASKFWKQHGPVQGPTSSALDLRLRLRCIFDSKDQVPKSLVMQLKQDANQARKKDAAAASSPPLVPTTRAPLSPSSSKRAGNAPPESLPTRRMSNQQTPTSISPKMSSLTRRPDTSSPPPSAKQVGGAETEKPAAAPKIGGIQQRLGLERAQLMADIKKKAERDKGAISAILNYKLSYAACAVLLVFTFLCAMYDESNVVIWLFGK